MGFYNLIHDNKHFNNIILLEFVICQCSNNASKWEQWFMKDLVQKLKILVFIDQSSIYLVIIIVIIIITIIIIIIFIIIITIIIIIIIIISLFALDRTISHHFLSAIIFRIAIIHLF